MEALENVNDTEVIFSNLSTCRNKVENTSVVDI